MGQKQLCQLHTHSFQKKFALNFYANLILQWKTNYSSLLPDFNKLSWPSLLKTTKKVKIPLHPPGPDQLCLPAGAQDAGIEWLGHSAARLIHSKSHFFTVQHPERLRSFTHHLYFLFFSLFIYFTILAPCAISIVLCAVVTDAGTSEMFKSFWKGCQSLLEKSWEENASGDPNVIKIISRIKKWLF